MRIKRNGEVVTIVATWGGGTNTNRWQAYHLMQESVPVAQLTLPAGLEGFRLGFKFKTGGADYEIIEEGKR